MNWTAFAFDGANYDLSHLDQFAYDLVVQAKGEKPEQIYRLNVAFSIHCFTRGPKVGESIPPELAYCDNRETRIFDFERYEQSKMLRQIIEALSQRKCYHDKHGNFYVFETTDANGVTAHYSIFFSLSRAGKAAGLNLYVTTAHVRPMPPYAKNPKPIRFDVIVHNVWNGKAIKPAP